MKVRSEHDLPTVRVLLGRTGSGSRSEVLFQTVRGRGAPADVVRTTASELGLPDTLPARWGHEVVPLPAYVLDALQPAVDALGQATIPPEQALWLELPSPRGYLYLLPWEQLLAPLGRPLLRLPNHTLRPQAASHTLEIVACASSPLAKEPFGASWELERLARTWVREAQHEVTVHLFTDASAYRDLALRVADLDCVTVHDPAAAGPPAAGPPAADPSGPRERLTCPWLRWIRDALGGRAVDVVHFATHGYLSGDRGAIALARTPVVNTDTRSSGFVGAAEMSTFLSQVGAWTLALTGPQWNYSPAGLRELADAVAQDRPGVVLVHELGADPDGGQLAQLVHTVYGEPGAAPDVEPMPGVTCWVHPRFVSYPAPDVLVDEQGCSTLAEGALHEVLNRDHTPAWVAAGMRALEVQQVAWLPDDEESGPADPDAVAALRSVSALLTKHARKELQS